MKFQLLKQAAVGPAVPQLVYDNLYSARENDLKVILYVLQAGTIDPVDISRKLNISIAAIQSSLLFWTDKGLILYEETAAEKPARKKILSSREILKIAQDNPEIEVLVNQLQKIYGHAINERGTNAFLNLHLQDNVPVEVILVLAMHLAPVQKGPIYTAKVIGNLYEKNGITSADKAEEYLALLEKREKLYTAVCGIFSLDKDKLKSSEKTMIDAWGESLGYGKEMIEAAFYTAGGNASLRYCGGILKSWAQKGYKAPQDIQEEFAFTGRGSAVSDTGRDDDLILQGMNIIPVPKKGE